MKGNAESVAATEQLSASIREISTQVSQAARTSQAASEEARITQGVVSTLRESAEQAGAVVDLISDIAERTNLLALNATIEAARAGEAGKGFAVVADEVKSLANQTASSTEQIAAQLQSMRDITQSALQAITNIHATVDQVNEISVAIAAAVEEQSSATEEIARGINQVTDDPREVTRCIEQVFEEATDVSGTAGAFEVSAQMLEEQVVLLKAHLDEAVSETLAHVQS